MGDHGWRAGLDAAVIPASHNDTCVEQPLGVLDAKLDQPAEMGQQFGHVDEAKCLVFAFIRFLVLFSGCVACYFAFDCDGTCDIMNAEFPKKKEHFLKEKNRLWRFLYGQSSDIW